jgi:hypothetical protein
MIEAFDWAGDFLTGAMRDWPEHSWRYSGGVCDPAFVNEFPPDRTADTADDAKRGRMAAHMIWALQEDEALIVEMDAHDDSGSRHGRRLSAAWTPVPTGQLHAYLTVGTATTSSACHRPRRSRCEPLDTQGFSRGNLTYRNLLSRTLRRSDGASSGRARRALPPDTAMVTKTNAPATQERYHGVKLRYGI